MSDDLSWLDKYRAAERADREREMAPLRRQAAILAMELSKARILPDNGKCNRCKVPFWADQCTQCWLEWSSRKAEEEAE